MTAMDSADLFQTERQVIETARQVLGRLGGGAGASAPEYRWLLEKYVRLCQQTRRLIQFGDRMQDALNRLNHRLHRSEVRYRSIYENATEGIFHLDPAGRLGEVNPAMVRMLGHESPDLVREDGSPFLDYVHPDDKSLVAAHIDDQTRAPLVQSIAFRIIDRQGNVRWLSHTCQPVYDENGHFAGRRAINREITAQKQAEAEKDKLTENLKKTSTLLNAVLDAIPDVIGVQDLDHNMLLYNKAGYRFVGLSPGQAHGQKCYALIGRKTPCPDCAAAEVLRTRQPAQVKRHFEKQDRWFDVRAYPIIDETGQITQVIEHLRDISREKRAETKLREAHERLVTILNSIDAHVYVAEIDSFRILFMNQKMIDDFEGDFTGQKCHECFHRQTRPCHHCTNKLLLDEDNNPRDVYTWQGKNPVTLRWYLNFDRAIKWVDERIVKIRIATDITDARRNEEERKKMQQQLQQAHRFEAIGTLAAGIAHDFNNLLMGIQGRASLLSQDMETHHPPAEHIDAIMDYIQSATDMTRQLLGLARGGKYEVRPIDINEVIAKTASMFGRTKKEIRIHSKLEPPELVVEADRRQIEQVLLNLFVNAGQAMPAGGDLYIETSTVRLDEAFCKPHHIQPGRHVRVTVKDTGTGMDEATCQRVFDPFFTTKAQGLGTGLGLASAYGIINNHAGLMTVHSQVGRGTTFTIFLPLSDHQALPEPSMDRELIQGTETILLVDDQQMIREVGRAMLERLGYRVLTADGGERAVAVIQEQGHNIDLVVLDMTMPGMGGGRTFDRIRDVLPGMPVLLCSGYSQDGQANDILRRGCNGFIHKPFHLSELSRKIREVIDGEAANMVKGPDA
jgi:PAS domain S-box-containing protein